MTIGTFYNHLHPHIHFSPFLHSFFNLTRYYADPSRKQKERSRIALVVRHDPRLKNTKSKSASPILQLASDGKNPLTQAIGSYSDNSSGANQSPISLVADSKASEAWIKLRPTETAYWPRTEPASASRGLVAPTIRRW